MEKREFTYNRLFIILIWMLTLGAPFVWFAPEVLDSLENPSYCILNILIMLGVVFALWTIVEKLPGTSKTGMYWKEEGITVIEYGKSKVNLTDVTEVFLTDKHIVSQRFNILIRNKDEKIAFLSKRYKKDINIEETEFYLLFTQVLAENPHLVQEKDVFGEPIEYWYKVNKEDL